jgi:NifB/MoaA-like Fe-S oxidoreductase
LACGTLIATTMRGMVDRINRHTGARIEVAEIENRYFGSQINVSGLLTGSDIVSALGNTSGNTPLYISSRMISDRTHTLLDDMTTADLSRELKRPVVPALMLSDVARDLRQRQRLRQAA